MPQWIQSWWWLDGKALSESGSPVPVLSSSSSHSHTRRLLQVLGSPKVTPSTKGPSSPSTKETRISECSQSPMSSMLGSWFSPRLQCPSDDDVPIQAPQTIVKTVGNNQEIITTVRTPKTYKKTILIQIQPSTDITSTVVKKRQDSVPSSCHNLIVPTRIPPPLNVKNPVDEDSSHGRFRHIGRRSSSTRKLSVLSSIPEHEIEMVSEQVRMPTSSSLNMPSLVVGPEDPLSYLRRNTSLFKEIMKR